MVQRNIAEENKNFVMVRFRLPKHVYRELAVDAAQHDSTATRLMIEILRAGAERRIKEREQKQKQLLESLDGFEDLTAEDFK